MATAPARKIPFLWILLVLLLLLGLWVIGKYNSLVNLDVAVEEKWAQVETQYQRRADLIPQLVETVKGVANFEQNTLVSVTEARTQWLNSQGDSNATREDQITAANAFDSAISRLLVTVEAYPTLNATENFTVLQAQLEGTENRVAVSRSDYNAVVKDYNRTVRSFPMMFFAGMFGFESTPFFEASQGAENAPKVEFNFE